MKSISQVALKELLNYNPETGVLNWIKARGNRPAGANAGAKHGEGYVQVTINRTNYLAHRLAWIYVNGSIGECDIDHINGIRNDNRICNLRQAERFENMQNISPPKNNSSGLIGCSFRAGKWMAKISVNRKQIYLGQFASKEDAHAAYLEAKKTLHKFQPEPRACDALDRAHKMKLIGQIQQ